MQPSKAASVMFTMPSGKIRLVSDLQSAKAYMAILFAALGKSTDERLVQPLKRLCEMLVMLSGSFTCVSLVQSSKAPEPSDSTVSGMVTSVRPLASKAFPPMIFTVSGIVISVSFSAFLKALAQMRSTVLL